MTKKKARENRADTKSSRNAIPPEPVLLLHSDYEDYVKIADLNGIKLDASQSISHMGAGRLPFEYYYRWSSVRETLGSRGQRPDLYNVRYGKPHGHHGVLDGQFHPEDLHPRGWRVMDSRSRSGIIKAWKAAPTLPAPIARNGGRCFWT